MTYTETDLRLVETQEADGHSHTIGSDWVEHNSGTIIASGRGFTNRTSLNDAVATALRAATGQRPRAPNRAHLEPQTYRMAVQRIQEGWGA